MYEYNSHLETEVLDQILEIVVAMMESKQRELLKGVLAFIKVSNNYAAVTTLYLKLNC